MYTYFSFDRNPVRIEGTFIEFRDNIVVILDEHQPTAVLCLKPGDYIIKELAAEVNKGITTGVEFSCRAGAER